MIKLTDSTLLALTKLRTHKVRTVTTLILASTLFGLLVAASLITTGGLRSIESLRSDGLTSRYIVQVSPVLSPDTLQRTLRDPQLIAEAKKRFEKLVEEKIAEARRLGLSYTQASDQPPYTQSSDGQTERLSLNDRNGITQALLQEKFSNQPAFNDSKLEDDAKSYRATKLFTSAHHTIARGSTLEAFADGKEVFFDKSDETETNASFRKSLIDGNQMTIAPSEITDPFMLPNNAGWKPDGTSLPIILPQNAVEELLKLKAPNDTASAQEKLMHLQLVRKGASELSFQACYRNRASTALIQQAIQQQKEIVANKDNKSYQKPSVTYALPRSTACENPYVTSDTRTASEKQQDRNRKLFDARFGESDEPTSYLVTFKVTGVSPTETGTNGPAGAEEQATSASDILNNILKTSGIGQAIPLALYQQLPNKEKYADLFTFTPLYLFGNEDNKQRFVEFATPERAQKFIDEQGCTTQMGGTCTPLGRPYQLSLAFTNSSAIEDIREKVENWFDLAMIGVIILAAIIMYIAVGRTITDGRHETAVFRAIGFKRSDIAAIYATYTITLSILAALLAAAIGWAGAYIANQQLSSQLTAQAQYSLGGMDMSKEINLIGIDQQSLIFIFAACVATGLLSMIIPLIRNVRRSPIRDMREE